MSLRGRFAGRFFWRAVVYARGGSSWTVAKDIVPLLPDMMMSPEVRWVVTEGCD